MTWVARAAGAALIAVVMWDIFRTLFNPSGQGPLSGAVMRAVWGLAGGRRGRSRTRAMAGPLALVAAIVAWVALAVLGWALVYLPQLPDGFAYESGLDPSRRSTVLDALYLSLTTLATLGYGDIVPRDGWLRVVAPLQALSGFAIVTAAISWGLQVYPALTRRRSLARRVAALRDAHALEVLPTKESSSPAAVLHELGAHLATVTVDLTMYTATQYFVDSEPRTSLADQLPYLHQLAQRCERSPDAEVRVAARALLGTIDSVAEVLDEQLVHEGGGTEAVLSAYAADRGC